MANVKFYSGEQIPLEMHKARMVQKLTLLPVDERKKSMEDAGFNTFLLKNRNVYMDMLTDSGVNAMSEKQYAAMLQADDSYAGSETFYRLEKSLNHVFGTKYFLPAHQGRACENIIAGSFVKPGETVLMNYHFTTAKALITHYGGSVEELVKDEGLKVNSTDLFKGDMDIERLKRSIKDIGTDKIAYLRVEAGTNLIGGQPVSMGNLRDISAVCRENGIMLVYDASLLADNLYFIKTREKDYENKDIRDITTEIASLCDIIYFSARKLGCARGGGIITSDEKLFAKMRELVPLFEGFLTYGGMSVREMEALAVGLYETLDIDVISQTPIFVEALCKEVWKKNVPTVTPPGGLGCHVDAMQFCSHIPQNEYPAGSLAAAFYIASGVRTMERGTLSEQRKPDGSETYASMELMRLAVPKRVFTLSQIKYAADRISWLYDNREIIGGLKFVEEPSVLRFFFGRLAPIGDWVEKLTAKYKADFGDSL